MPAFRWSAATDNLFPTFYSNNPPVRRPAGPTFGAGRVDRAAALVEHIRYKVIIRIRLSFPASDICCSMGGLSSAPNRHGQGSEICPGRRPLSWKYASAWRSPATCRPNSDRVGDVRLQCWRPRVCCESCGRRWIFLMERPLSRSVTRAGRTGQAPPKCQSGLTVSAVRALVYHERGV